MEDWIHFNESVQYPVWISCALTKNLPRCMFISSTPIYTRLQSSHNVDSQSFLRHSLLMFCIDTLDLCCIGLLYASSSVMFAYASQIFVNDVINARQNKWLFALDTDMDRALLRLSHIQKGTCYVQICDKIYYFLQTNFLCTSIFKIIDHTNNY